MTTIRVRIDAIKINKLKNEYENRIFNEFGIIPTASNLVNIALLELEGLKTNREVEIKFNKNGKIKYKFK